MGCSRHMCRGSRRACPTWRHPAPPAAAAAAAAPLPPTPQMGYFRWGVASAALVFDMSITAVAVVLHGKGSAAIIAAAAAAGLRHAGNRRCKALVVGKLIV